MRRRGISFTLVATVLFVIGDVTGTGWVQIADAFLWSALVISPIVPIFSGARLAVTPRVTRVRQDGGPGPVQGDEVVFAAELRNPRPWPRLGVTVAYKLFINGVHGGTSDGAYGREVKLYVPYIDPHGTARVEGQLPVPRRGLYTLSDGRSGSDAPFGLFRRRSAVKGEMSVLVYPAPLTVDAGVVHASHLASAESALPVRVGEEVSGSRPFAMGDAVRQIHWRNSARAGRLLSKSFTSAELDTPVLVIGTAPGDEVGLDDETRVAAGVGEAWAVRGFPVHLQGAERPGPAAWAELLGQLARVTSAMLPTVGSALRSVPPGSTLAVVIPSDDREGVRAVVSAAGRMASVSTWLLTRPRDDGSEEDDVLTQTGAAALRRAGVTVTLVERPLPLPEPLGTSMTGSRRA